MKKINKKLITIITFSTLFRGAIFPLFFINNIKNSINNEQENDKATLDTFNSLDPETFGEDTNKNLSKFMNVKVEKDSDYVQFMILKEPSETENGEVRISGTGNKDIRLIERSLGLTFPNFVR